MTLIEDRVRDEAKNELALPAYTIELLRAAAEEIERLRGELARAQCTGGKQ